MGGEARKEAFELPSSFYKTPKNLGDGFAPDCSHYHAVTRISQLYDVFRRLVTISVPGPVTSYRIDAETLDAKPHHGAERAPHRSPAAGPPRHRGSDGKPARRTGAAQERGYRCLGELPLAVPIWRARLRPIRHRVGSLPSRRGLPRRGPWPDRWQRRLRIARRRKARRQGRQS